MTRLIVNISTEMNCSRSRDFLYRPFRNFYLPGESSTRESLALLRLSGSVTRHGTQRSDFGFTGSGSKYCAKTESGSRLLLNPDPGQDFFFDKMFTKFIIVRENFVYQKVKTVLGYTVCLPKPLQRMFTLDKQFWPAWIRIR